MKVAVGLSGGVDSAVSALLLQAQGHEVVGITMKLWNGKYKGGERDACFGKGEEGDIESAERLAAQLKIPYRVYDCSAEYDRTIIDYFRRTYLKGDTPNPCVFCNRLMKFGLLPELARRSGMDFEKFATGHYARVIHNEATGRYELHRAVDEGKDQSYFLYRLTQEQLSRQLFPMGDMTKAQVRAIAREHNLPMADKPDSQDFYSGDVAELLGRPDEAGDIVTLDGRVLGRHRGFWHYTVGQRKGLGIGGGTPYYVVRLDACRNEVVVGFEHDVKKTSLDCTNLNWVSMAEPEPGKATPCTLKVRSAGAPKGPAEFELKDDKTTITARFPEGLSGVAPGQSAVFYAGTKVLAGGVIARAGGKDTP